MKNEKREVLEKLSIYELRIKARNAGVKSPTSKKHEVLVDEILKIQNGELQAVKSKMGRPPKNSSMAQNYESLVEKGTLINPEYDKLEPSENGEYSLRANETENICFQTFEFMGIVREIDGEFLLQDYLNSYMHVYLGSKNSCEFEAGDLIKGTAKKQNDIFGQVIEWSKASLGEINQICDQSKAKVLNLANEQEMYTYINNNCPSSIVVEAEASFINKGKLLNSIYLYTNQCDDIVKTNNMLLDVKNMVVNLNNQGKVFNLFFIDVEYIYSILAMYYATKNCASDANAGQYFKELICEVLKGKGQVTFLQKTTGKRSSYLEIILSKYCENVK